jgi:putative ABC transport system substrate-binding protein
VVDGTPTTAVAKAATTTIPIVFTLAGDPVGTGLVASLARPGGNVTGLSNLTGELSGKQLQLLKEAIPPLTRVAILYNPINPATAAMLSRAKEAARALAVEVQPVEVREPGELASTFSAMSTGRAGAFLALADAVLTAQRGRLLDLAARNRLPAMYATRDWAEGGGLMAYGPSFADNFRRAATFVDKILKGARPADLPVEQPTKFELVINLKTAKALGLTIPQSVLLRADEVIQ